MKIIELRAENVKKLTAVTIRPDGNLVQICGPNGSGKTSVLDSIMWALGGTKSVQARPVRRGAKSGVVRLDLGELVVTRKFAEDGNSTVTVESADGARFPSPQAMLDRLLGTIAFDPLAFARMKPREQFDTLRSLVKVDVDFDALDRQQKGDYERRADLNKEAKALRAQVAAYQPFRPRSSTPPHSSTRSPGRASTTPRSTCGRNGGPRPTGTRPRSSATPTASASGPTRCGSRPTPSTSRRRRRRPRPLRSDRRSPRPPRCPSRSTRPPSRPGSPMRRRSTPRSTAGPAATNWSGRPRRPRPGPRN
jgi:energy-coupling factor transporter ATP-binding protein EcfA2